jgi:hypothetical protein
MRIRTSNGFWLGCFLFLLAVTVGILAFGYYRYQVERNRPTEARRIAGAATITGFVRTAVLDTDYGGRIPQADAFFIGPAPNPDVLMAVSVPTVRLTALDPPPAPDESAPPRDRLFAASGLSEDRCTSASVIFVVSDPPLSIHSRRRRGTNPRGEEVTILTPAQQEAVRNHTAVLIDVSVSSCDR